MINFFDTSSLLLRAFNLFEEPEEVIVISSITLSELENIKTNTHKDAEIKFTARKLLNILDNNFDKVKVIQFKEEMLNLFPDFTVNNDLKILASYCSDEQYNNIIDFYTNDLALKAIAMAYIDKARIKSVDENPKDPYVGYKEVVIENDEKLSNFFADLEAGMPINHFGLKTNEYLIIHTPEEKDYFRTVWVGDRYAHLNYRSFKSKWFGEIKPMPGDPYQAFAADSFKRNKLTMVKGPAGTGKSLLALSYLFSCLETRKIDKIIIFCNTVATKNSARLGFYPGTKDEKLLDSQIGNVLSSKLGGKKEVEQLINEERLLLLPFSDIRGYDTSNMKAGIYISEAQNLDISLMKLALQRIGDDSFCIIDGDDETQVDLSSYEGLNNGMKRVSKIFRGKDLYGEVKLKNIHRSKIAKIAEDL